MNHKKDNILNCIIITKTWDNEFILKDFKYAQGRKYDTYSDLKKIVQAILIDIGNELKEENMKIGKKRQLRVWEKPIPKNQRRYLSICPKCGKRFYYWQFASKHAEENKHWGNYSVR